MPTSLNNGHTTSTFMFNYMIEYFGVPKQIVMDHGSRFQNTMMIELPNNLGFKQELSSPYYPQYNGQVEVYTNI